MGIAVWSIHAAADPRAARAADEQPAVAPRPAGLEDSLSVLVTISDGQPNRYRVRVHAVDPRQGSRTWNLEGDVAEIEKRLEQLPAEIRSQVRGSVTNAAVGQSARRTFRLVLQPQREGPRNYRIIIDRPGSDGRPQLFQLDCRLDATRAGKVEAVLQIEAVQEQLRELSPEIRQKIEQTLQQVKPPAAPPAGDAAPR